jgi:hypothetical protein
VALVNESMQTGVHMHTAPGASYADRDREALLDHLACRVYAGHGAHGLFMKTWSAGLAYSNGLGANLAEGTRSYYAERCPDLAETMRFVVGEIAGATVDSTLAAYAVAQVFRANRAAERYEQRGAAMANDLAAGRTPELVRGFRRSLLELGREPELAAALQPRLAAVHAAILPGLARRSPAMAAGASRDATAPGTVTFVIGSTPLLDAWENYLVEVDAGATLQRIYPRDYWDPPPGGPTSD